MADHLFWLFPCRWSLTVYLRFEKQRWSYSIFKVTVYLISLNATTCMDRLMQWWQLRRSVIVSVWSSLASWILISDKKCLLDEVSSQITVADIDNVDILWSLHVEHCLKELGRNKSDGTNLLSRHFVLASSVIVPLLADLFSTVLRHGYFPAAVYSVYSNRMYWIECVKESIYIHVQVIQ